MAIVSVRIGQIGPIRARKRPRSQDGLRYSQTFDVLRIRPSGAAIPSFGQTIWVSVWEDASDLDGYEQAGGFMADSYGLRLEPVRQYGSHRGIGKLADIHPSDDGIGPYAVITTGVMTNPLNMPRFMKHGAAATSAVMASPSLLAVASAMSPPNKFLSFTLWRDLAGMRAAVDGSGGATGHRDAKAARSSRPFMGQDDTFIRFKPVSSTGLWNGDDPLK